MELGGAQSFPELHFKLSSIYIIMMFPKVNFLISDVRAVWSLWKSQVLLGAFKTTLGGLLPLFFWGSLYFQFLHAFKIHIF